MQKTAAQYPQHQDMIERLARKTITRIVSDGIPQDKAIKEAVNFMQLNRQQIFHLCSVLEDFGAITNSDYKNYYFTHNDMGKEFPNTNNGYVVYAGLNDKNSRMNEIFATVEALKKQGFADQDILNINSELKEVLDVIAEVENGCKALVAEFKSSEQTAMPQEKGWLEKGKDFVNNLIPQNPSMNPAIASSDFSKTIFAQINDGEEVGETEKATPQNIQKLKTQEPKADLEVAENEPEIQEEDGLDLGGDGLDNVEEDNMGTGENVSAPIKPAPHELLKQIEMAPKWDVQNVLSMQMAENYYKTVQKDLDAVVNNPNINWSSAKGAISEYDKVRAAIENALTKITEAQKGAEKIEKKETDLQQKYPNKSETPTEELISGEPIEEEPVAGV